MTHRVKQQAPATLVALDSGLREAGVSVFQDGELLHAFLARNPERTARGPGAWLSMAEEVYARVERLFPDAAPHVQVLAMEVPQVYTQDKAHGVNPDDLIQLVGVEGAIAGMLAPVKAVGFTPRQWKGQVPKEIHNKRILAALSPEEKEAIEECPASLLHNVIDSIGVGLFYLGRMGSNVAKAGR
jgi:hypothetical protein